MNYAALALWTIFFTLLVLWGIGRWFKKGPFA